MAYDKTNRKLYIDESSDKGGLALWEIYDCLRYNKRDSRGNRNLGMVIVNGRINKWNIDKPFTSSEPNFASDSDKATARKNVYQSLLIPTPQNAGIADSPEWGKMYLGKLAYQALVASNATPNWDYVRPRGVTANYTEHFRMADFDGYEHFAEQPFDTKASLVDHSTLTPVEANGVIVTINRFVLSSVRFFFQMTNGNVKMSLADLFPAEDVKGYFFVVEEYNDVLFGSNSQNEFFARIPDKVHRAEESIAEIETIGGYQALQVDLDNTYDGKTHRFVLGANYYTSASAEYPTNQGKGFIAPREVGYNPFIFSFKVEYFGVIAYRQLNGFYYKAGPTLATFNLKDYNRYTYEKNYSDIVGISINLKRRAEGYYITGSTPSDIPSGVKTFQFRLLFQQQDRRVVGIISDATMVSGDTTTTQYIDRGEDWETVYLKFPRFILAGEMIDSAVLAVSADGGATWASIDASATADAYGFEFATDCDGSSVKLMLEGTIN